MLDVEAFDAAFWIGDMEPEVLEELCKARIFLVDLWFHFGVRVQVDLT